MAAVHPYLDHPGPVAFAHRGGAGEWPENTWPAFHDAVALGFTHLETDVHVTADGVALAFHDHVLDRVTDRVGAISTLAWDEVRRARVGGREEIVRLEDLLAAFPDRFVNLDPKHDAAIEPLARAVERTGALDRVCVGSFSDRRIAALQRRLGPGLCVSAGPRAVARLRAASLGAHRLRTPPVRCVQVPVRQGPVTVVDARFVAEMTRRGLPVHVWTIDDPAEMHRLLDLGVTGIMTDRPRLLRDVLRARGQWPGD